MNVPGEVLHQRRIHIEVDYVGLVFVGENLAEECSADFFLHVEQLRWLPEESMSMPGRAAGSIRQRSI